MLSAYYTKSVDSKYIFDEWDFIFNRGLLKDKSYVALAYMTAKGIKVYNPRSVVLALANDYCQSYWTNTGAMDEVLEYLKYNVHEVREDVIRMVDGELIRVNIREEFRAGQGKPKNKVEIYSAMIVLGFLSYYNNRLKIPNKEYKDRDILLVAICYDSKTKEHSCKIEKI